MLKQNHCGCNWNPFALASISIWVPIIEAIFVTIQISRIDLRWRDDCRAPKDICIAFLLRLEYVAFATRDWDRCGSHERRIEHVPYISPPFLIQVVLPQLELLH